MTDADPDAIDLEAIRNYRGGDKVFDTAAIIDLIAAVEALRERVDGLLLSLSMSLGEKDALRSRVLGLETAFAFITNMEGQDGMTDALFAEKTLALAHTSLAATPAEALERARAVEEVASAALNLSGAMVEAEGKDCDFSPVDEKWSALTAALANLDTISKKEKENAPKTP